MKNKISITLDVHVHKALLKMAEKDDRTLSNLINVILKQYIEENESSDKK